MVVAGADVSRRRLNGQGPHHHLSLKPANDDGMDLLYRSRPKCGGSLVRRGEVRKAGARSEGVPREGDHVASVDVYGRVAVVGGQARVVGEQSRVARDQRQVDVLLWRELALPANRYSSYLEDSGG